jgi:hypothetical protein
MKWAAVRGNMKDLLINVLRDLAGKARRTTHRSRTGTKLYAVRDSKGRLKDIQTYKRAHGHDIKRKSKKEK